MIQITNPTQCCGCALCAECCPVQCVHMVPDGEGCLYPWADAEKCIACGQCEESCPILHASSRADDGARHAFAATHKDTDVRMNSSSGGAFSALAKAVIQAGGAVFGAAFDKNMQLKHTAAETMKDLLPLMGSKYVQSDLTECYPKMLNVLEADRQVLFCGTPCQCAAVRKLTTHEKLITASVVCHGVPVPSLWTEYRRRCEAAVGSPLVGCNMRDKRGGWVNYKITTAYANGETRSEWNRENPFFAAYLSNQLLRPACTDCMFKGDYNVADIILGDLWSAKKVCGRFADATGTSAVIVQTDRGAELMAQAEDFLRLHQVTFDAIADENPMLDRSPKTAEDAHPTAADLLAAYAVPHISPLMRVVKLKHDIRFRFAVKRLNKSKRRKK